MLYIFQCNDIIAECDFYYLIKTFESATVLPISKDFRRLNNGQTTIEQRLNNDLITVQKRSNNGPTTIEVVKQRSKNGLTTIKVIEQRFNNDSITVEQWLF